ncbi:MAG: amidohydrolase family protein [Armatimonadota bacterium]|nr:amidohydrolase family protein [Armatimonadota bacterium]
MNTALKEALRLGQTLAGEVIIDAHAHMGPWYNFHIPEGGTPASMVHAMDRLGIRTSIISPHLCIGPGYREGNQHAYAAAAEYPGRLVPFVTINPNYPRSEIEAEIAHWEKNGGIVGFKFHTSLHGAPANHPGYYPALEYAQAHHLPILSHNWVGTPMDGKPTLYGLAEAFPGVTFIIGHACGAVEANCEAARRYANIVLDTTGSALGYDVIPEMVRRVGAERITFGTDNPFIDPRPGLGRMLMARISDDEKRLILGLNARRLFRLP